MSELLHADTLSHRIIQAERQRLTPMQLSYLLTEFARLLTLAVNVVEKDYDNREQAIEELEEYLR